ncbi:uncharacterized protein SCHCODRAFT_02498147 [Schizophyllum commune H4-8]|nr:uncharacterized protein SCHCODRAFT_02498147 [Schizophyllum commune H4-8]KAI5894186.1 hypothetical protein SCHCODRAFT_02498147 [Schizophyllum commune H4-8]
MHVDLPATQSGMHTQATHRCLFIPEVLALICEACIDPPDVDSVAARNRGMRSLVRLARTCKTIYAVAIRCIWQSVTEIAILAEYTMPGCWEIIRDHPEVDEGVPSSVILPARSIQEEDLKRFRFHAAFVKKMSFGGSDWPRLFVDDCIIALCLTATGPLLPNLTYIAWDVELNLFYLQYFASPTTLELRINGGSLTVGDAYILRSTPRWFPNLTDLYVGYSSSLADGAKQAIDILGKAICGWKLRKLETSHIKEEALRRLAELPSLCVLTLEGGPVQIGRAVNALFGNPQGPRLGFLQLSELVVKTPGLRLRHAGSRDCCTFPALETLELGLLLDPWQATFMQISNLCPSRPRLRRLVLEDEDHPAAGVSQPIPATDIRLLGPYTHLEELILTSIYGFHVDEADVLWIARSWPKLRVLHLRPKYRQRDDARRRIPPLHALRHLARHCPRLADLAIEVDATAVPLAEAPTDAVQMELRLWRAGWSPITAQSVPYVAAYLSTVFPCVQNIVSTMPGATLHVPENLNWREVCSLIPVFNAVQGHAYRRLMHGSADSGEVIKRMVGLVE